MIIDTKEASVESSFTPQSTTNMSISAEGVAHLMTLLTNLYKDFELAVIREYFANALDSHIESGQTRPIEISLPSPYNPVYIVQDFGLGMSVSDIENIYAQYGASTKRHSNDVVGAYGLGCKSALTMATQFTLTAIKDGVKASVLIAKTESGINTVNIINTAETDEDNGVTVTIPVSDRYSFNNKAHGFFKFIDPSLVLVDGQPPKSVFDRAKELTNPDDPDFTAYLNVTSLTPSYVLMGTIPYLLSREEISESIERVSPGLDSTQFSSGVYFKVGIGEMDLVPSREGLRFTDKTKDRIDRLVKSFTDALRITAQQELDEQTDRAEVITVHKMWSDRGIKDLLWNGETPLSRIKIGPFNRVDRDLYGNSEHVEGVFIPTTEPAIIVTGETSYKRMRAYLAPYMRATDIDEARFIFTNEVIDSPWILENSNFQFTTDESILEIAREYRKKEREERKANPSLVPAKEKLAYPVLDVDEAKIEWIDYDEIPSDIAYLALEDCKASKVHESVLSPLNSHRAINKGHTETLLEHVKAISDADKVVLVTGTRSAKALTARVPGLRNLLDDMVKASKSVHRVLPKSVQRHVFARQHYSFSSIHYRKAFDDLDMRVSDKVLRDLLIPDQKSKKLAGQVLQYNKSVDYFGFKAADAQPVEPVRVSGFKEDVEYALTTYPLLHRATPYNSDEAQHLVFYANAVHRESKKS